MAEKKPGVLNKAWNSRGAAWTAAVVLGVVLLLTIALIVWNTVDSIDADDDRNDEQPTAPAAAQPTTTATQNADGCDVPVGDTDLRPAIPTDLRWEAANGGTWPVSDTYGPTQDEDGFGVCFARSPLGAALAAASFWTAEYSGHSGKETVLKYAAESAGKEILVSKTKAESSIPAETFPINGFIVDGFSEDEAVITTVYTASNSPTGFVGIPLTFEWVDDDWKLSVPVSGDYLSAPSTPVEGQFVPWRAP